MIGNKISHKDMQQYHNKIVYVTFDISNLTFYGDETEYYDNIDSIASEYPDGLFRFEFEKMIKIDIEFIDGRLISVNNPDQGLSLSHNFVDEIYEWIED